MHVFTRTWSPQSHSGTNKEQPVSGNLENLGVAVVDDSPFSILLVGS